MAENEDVAPTTESRYPYAWLPNTDMSLKDFLVKYKPSMVQDDGSKPWIWVHKSSSTKSDHSDKAIEEATEYLKDATEKVESIKNDDSIPVRANKKKGTKSKKEVREEIQNEATEKLKDISVRHDFVSGKWLIFSPTDKVDVVWSSIATSLIEGPLSSTCADLVKVATYPKTETSNYQHVLCLYMPNVYDKDAVLEVMKVLLGKHGMTLMGVKSNLYTAINLDSKHASGIQSTVWRNTALMKDTEMKELKDKFYADLITPKIADTKTDAVLEESSAIKSKTKFKKKVVDDDFFASDAEDKKPRPQNAAPTEKKTPPKPSMTGFKRTKSESDEDKDEDEDERPKKKTGKK